MKIYKLFPLVLTCRRGPYNEPEEQYEGEDGFDEALPMSWLGVRTP